MFESPGSDANHTLPIRAQTSDDSFDLSRGSDVQQSPRIIRKRSSIDPTLHEFQMCPIEEADHFSPHEASEAQRTPGQPFQVLLPTVSSVSSWNQVELSSPMWEPVLTASVARSSVSANLDLASKRSYSDISRAEADRSGGLGDARQDALGLSADEGEHSYLSDYPRKQRISSGIPAVGGRVPAFETQGHAGLLLQRSPSKRLRTGSGSLLSYPHSFSSPGKDTLSAPASIPARSHSVSRIHSTDCQVFAATSDVLQGSSAFVDLPEGSPDTISSTPDCGFNGPPPPQSPGMVWTSEEGEAKGVSTYLAQQELYRSLIRQKSDTPEPDTLVTATYSNVCCYSPDVLFSSNQECCDDTSAA